VSALQACVSNEHRLSRKISFTCLLVTQPEVWAWGVSSPTPTQVQGLSDAQLGVFTVSP